MLSEELESQLKNADFIRDLVHRILLWVCANKTTDSKITYGYSNKLKAWIIHVSYLDSTDRLVGLDRLFTDEEILLFRMQSKHLDDVLEYLVGRFVNPLS